VKYQQTCVMALLLAVYIPSVRNYT